MTHRLLVFEMIDEHKINLDWLHPKNLQDARGTNQIFKTLLTNNCKNYYKGTRKHTKIKTQQKVTY